MSTEPSGKPDAWKLARPVWGWGRGETPRPTPLRGEQPSSEISKDIEPSKEHGRLYLDLLKEQIALFKGGK